MKLLLIPAGILVVVIATVFAAGCAAIARAGRYDLEGGGAG